MIDFENMAVGEVKDMPERWIPDGRAEYNRAQALTVESGGTILFSVESHPITDNSSKQAFRQTIKRTA